MEQSKVYSAVLLQSEYSPTPEVEAAIREEARAALGQRELVMESEGGVDVQRLGGRRGRGGRHST